MPETFKQQSERAVLVGVITENGTDTSEVTIKELEELAKTAGANVIGIMTQRRPSPDAATYIGEGKLAELAAFCENNEAELVIFDDELSGSQQRNIENAVGVRVIDRSALILDIFASRAVSSEGKLQVELAQLKYMLPRLSGKGSSLSRLGGGIGTRGPGETQLETDRRHIRRRIEKLQNELSEVEKRRKLARERRNKDGFLSVVLAGYTNAGKSTLMNTLTNAGVLSENMLFATLDPTARALELPNGQTVMLLDTVGFIRKLPHHLIKAFRSTLEEAAEADLLLVVSDISDTEYASQLNVSLKLLDDIGCRETPLIKVFNKCDINGEWHKNDDENVYISAFDGRGTEDLLKIIAKRLSGSFINAELLIPYAEASVLSFIRDNGKIISEDYKENGIRAKVIADKKFAYKFKDFEVKK